ncbi:MAG: DUF3825 domain-containing protein [Cyanobacteria bacterium J06573_11]
MTSFFAALSRFLRRWFHSNRSANRNGSHSYANDDQNGRLPLGGKNFVDDRSPAQSSYPKIAPPDISVVSNELRRLVYRATCDMPKPRMHAGQFGSRLRRIDSGFSYEKYGFTKLTYLLESVPDIVELERVNHSGAAPAYYVRSVLNVQPLLRTVLENFDSEDGWVHQDSVLSMMTAQASAFSIHTYGFDSTQSFLESHANLLEFNPVEHSYVRLRQPAATSGASPPRRLEQNGSYSDGSGSSGSGNANGNARRVNLRPPNKAASANRPSPNGASTSRSPINRTVVDSTVESVKAVQLPLESLSRSQDAARNGRSSSIVHLSKFAGFSPQVLNQKVSELAAIALSERWYFGPQPPDDFAYPILKSYLRYTFIRLQHERKVLASTNQQYRAFNTGLLDKLLRPIYALLTASGTAAQAWDLSFCIPGEGLSGKALSANFATLPLAANYLKEPAKIFYHLAAGTPEVDWHHIIKDNMERLPPAFLSQYAPTNFTHRNTNTLNGSEFHAYKRAFAAALDANPASYRSIVNRLKEALSRTLLKTQLNYKTAVPTYYPNINSIDLLLPICLVEEDIADCAIVVRRADSGKYIGHTILTLRQAYNNARLICKLDEHWLTRSMTLSQSAFEEEEDDSEEFESESDDIEENRFPTGAA